MSLRDYSLLFLFVGICLLHEAELRCRISHPDSLQAETANVSGELLPIP
jgi:hypothetical protein